MLARLGTSVVRHSGIEEDDDLRGRSVACPQGAVPIAVLSSRIRLTSYTSPDDPVKPCAGQRAVHIEDQPCRGRVSLSTVATTVDAALKTLLDLRSVPPEDRQRLRDDGVGRRPSAVAARSRARGRARSRDPRGDPRALHRVCRPRIEMVRPGPRRRRAFGRFSRGCPGFSSAVLSGGPGSSGFGTTGGLNLDGFGNDAARE